MTDGLFGVTELAGPDERPGFRLDRLEVLNWGTFNQRIWAFDLRGRNALLTGEIGSGKSTIVDAVTTLLMPTHKISYNKAAGAETRERDLRSYVRGYYKTAHDEVHGTSRPVGLREGDTFSVILGVFANEAMGRQVSLAQVFYTKSGDTDQPDRFFVTAEHELSIAKDFTEFGTQIQQLTRRLRDDGAEVVRHFPDYGKSFRRALGIASEQAMELFAQTVSMKAVGDLNDFVRSHMLEPTDVSSQVDQVVTHFDDLSRAYDAVVKAKQQLAKLEPLLAEGDEYDAQTARAEQFSRVRTQIPAYFDRHRSRLLAARLAALDADTRELTGRRDASLAELEGLGDEQDQLKLERAQLGGDRLVRLEAEIAALQAQRAIAAQRAEEFDARLASVGLEPVIDEQGFTARRAQIDEASTSAQDALTALRETRAELIADRRRLDAEIRSIQLDLRSLQERGNSIPRDSVDLRRDLCAALGIDPEVLPFAGELIAVAPESLEWEGAAERLLHAFGLSMLVPEQHYADVAAWINARHLGKRIVYYRVADHARRGTAKPSAGSLAAKLQVKPGPYEAWITDELSRRADVACADTMDEFREARRAVTREGQIKGTGGRHEKDDRHRIDDRRRYVLGWSNERTVAATLAEAQRLGDELLALGEAEQTTERDEAGAQARMTTAVQLTETRSFVDIDWRGCERRITELRHEQDEIERGSDALASVGARLEQCEQRIREESATREKLVGQLAVARSNAQRAGEALTVVAGRLDATGTAETDPDLAEQLAGFVPADVEDCDVLQHRAEAELSSAFDTARDKAALAARRLTARMSDFRRDYPLDTQELDSAVESLPEFRQMHQRIAGDDLPRFEEQFKDYLNKNAIRDVASLHAELLNAEELIRNRVDRINESLATIDYNPGRYIKLVHTATRNLDVRSFRADLLACTAGATAGETSEQYSEQKFFEVKRLVERFRGREGFGEADKRWTRQVTDVRNWLEFSASERWKDTDVEHEHYSDSSGKSGGQKEKLAYTILAASLAYQFGLRWGATQSHNFQFVVIDEAFGRGSDESTRFALDLFARLGLQLLVVTPKQKIGVIAPYVSTIGFVDNVDGDDSRIQVLTIEEYEARRKAL